MFASSTNAVSIVLTSYTANGRNGSANNGIARLRPYSENFTMSLAKSTSALEYIVTNVVKSIRVSLKTYVIISIPLGDL